MANVTVRVVVIAFYDAVVVMVFVVIRVVITVKTNVQNIALMHAPRVAAGAAK